MTAYQRWELAALREAEAAKQPPPAPPEPPPPPPEPVVEAAPEPEPEPEPIAEPVDPVQWPTAEDIENIHRQAFEEGYNSGLQEGRAQAAGELGRIRAIADNFFVSNEGLDLAIADQLVDVAIELARQVMRGSLAAHPEQIIHVVREAIAEIPGTPHHPRIVLNPADAQLVKELLEAEIAAGQWRIFEDEQMALGGCRIETANSEIDASLTNRWSRVVAALGRNHDWAD